MTQSDCALGRNENLFVAFVDVCEEKGEGYVDYLWPKPTKDGLTADQPKLTYVRYFEPWDWIIGTGVYTDDIDQIIAGRQRELKEQLNRLNIFLAAISLLVAALAFIATPIFVKRLLGPLTNVADTLKELSGGGGDLSFRLQAEGKDEVGRLSRHFNQFMETLSSLIGQVKTITGQNDRLSGNLLQTTELSSTVQEQINGNMRDISEKSGILDQDIAILNMVTGDMNSFINEVVNQITEQASAITESSAAIEEMSSSINNLERVTESKIELTEKLRGMASTGEELMQETIKRIKTVGNSATIILELISVIDEITDRTNILAMNAAIEAAQAGEAGKGFAVVADEIRKLADSTAFNAREISVSLKGVIEEIKTSEASTLQTGETFQSITEGVMDVTASMREIQNSMIELAEGGKQITISLSDLIRITEDVKTSSSGMTGKMGQVQKSLRSVTAISTQNKQGIEEVTQGIERLSRNTGIVNDTGKENRELVEKLKATIGKFKLGEDLKTDL